MKILVSSDWHIGVTSFGILDENGKNSRLLDVANTIRKISKFALEQNVDLLVHCGDVFHTNRPTVEEQLIFYWFLHDVQRVYGIDVRVIIGNHDYNSQIGKGHALKLFQTMFEGSGIKIFDETIYEMINDHLFIWYPYAAEEPDIIGAIKKHTPERTFLVCHSHLEGAIVGAEPFEIKDDKATKFRDLPVDGVFAGHFHKPQLLSDKPLAFYPGSIQPVDFSERNDVKGVVLVDTEEISLQSVGFKTRPMVQIDYIAVPDGPVMFNWERYNVKDAIVKVNIESDESSAHTFDENLIREQVMAAGAHSIASINLNVVRNEVKRDPDIKIDSDIKSNFIRYLKQKDYGDLSDKIKETGCSIIEECAS